MITRDQYRKLLNQLLEGLEIPDSAYQKAEERYQDIGNWLGRDNSSCAVHDPHVFPQGSFRLGTAIRPIDMSEPYDLDLACKLQEGITKGTHTQQELKYLVGAEIEAYRIARGVKAPREEKHRCWRLNYADTLSFHMDIVPCIPADETRQCFIEASMRRAGADEYISTSISRHTVSITDDQHPLYKQLCDDWHISNPEGYALWFESRMNQDKMMIMDRAQIDKIPAYKRKTPLQRVVQLLKRHRDWMFRDAPNLKPISIIITTLAARAYHGEEDIISALSGIMERMESFINQTTPRVPNPVDPDEDFADKWRMPQYLYLEKNFLDWLAQARDDFRALGLSDDPHFIARKVKDGFSVDMNAEGVRNRLGLAAAPTIIVSPKTHVIEQPARPWSRGRS
ncbi:MAG TPA: nucleotidyltransferase [Methanoregulaceae archaeon]|nr:MAG: hypothetical protein BWX92_03012 [Deltaproteobacteria bacterium ADurb.Bin135]HPA08562.1 nucleotidyltransferase [Methanoregulaceae archaeon]